jgi:hypothetical protein
MWGFPLSIDDSALPEVLFFEKDQDGDPNHRLRRSAPPTIFLAVGV